MSQQTVILIGSIAAFGVFAAGIVFLAWKSFEVEDVD